MGGTKVKIPTERICARCHNKDDHGIREVESKPQFRWMEGSDEKGPSLAKDVAREVPWIVRVKGRGRLLKGLANVGSRLRRARDREEVTQVEDLI